jgi:hypothetical protein
MRFHSGGSNGMRGCHCDRGWTIVRVWNSTRCHNIACVFKWLVDGFCVCLCEPTVVVLPHYRHHMVAVTDPFADNLRQASSVYPPGSRAHRRGGSPSWGDYLEEQDLGPDGRIVRQDIHRVWDPSWFNCCWHAHRVWSGTRYWSLRLRRGVAVVSGCHQVSFVLSPQTPIVPAL